MSNTKNGRIYVGARIRATWVPCAGVGCTKKARRRPDGGIALCKEHRAQLREEEEISDSENSIDPANKKRTT